MYSTLAKAARSNLLNIAHRGARSLAPENTLAAARKALMLGAHMWELDVRLSRDGHLVVIHDATLDRTSNAAELFPDRAPWRVEEFTLGELRSLDMGSWFVENDPFGLIGSGEVTPAMAALYCGEVMPLLEDALLFTLENNWFVNVEIKDLQGQPGHNTIAGKTVDTIVSLGAIDRVLVSSFQHEYLARIKRLDQRITTGALVGKPPGDPLAMMEMLGAASYHPALRAVRPGDLLKMKEKGYLVFVYTVNNMKIARTLRSIGASGIFTDFPQRCGKLV